MTRPAPLTNTRPTPTSRDEAIEAANEREALRKRSPGIARRGFASLTPERRKELASRGGKAARDKGTAHRWTPEEAREAGRRGGNTVSRSPLHMSQIGRKGGHAAAKVPRRRPEP